MTALIDAGVDRDTAECMALDEIEAAGEMKGMIGVGPESFE